MSKVFMPTEAQWEYACRAGTDSPLCGGAWFDNGGGCRFASRFGYKPDFCIFDTGFRLALVS